MSLIRRLRLQQGFTTVTLMGVMSVGALLVAGGFAAVNPDIGMSRNDQDYKQAYGAAEAGVQWYLSSLARDNSYYLKCTTVARPSPTEAAPVNNKWNGNGADPRVWRNLIGSGGAQYTVELLPAPGYAQCVVNDQFSMVDPTGNMRLRVSGRSRGQTRSIIVTLRRRNFIDFIYFTHFETLDPLAYATSQQQSSAGTNCAKFRAQRGGSCTEIQFASDDNIKGPLHTNDSALVCGSPTFGRYGQDAIELNGSSPGYFKASGCSLNPEFLGTVVFPAGQMELPSSNMALQTLAQSGYLFQGRTKIEFEGTSMKVTLKNGTVQTKPLPTNGVIYVRNENGCSVGYNRNQTYNNPAACGDAWVKGNYSGNITIAADNDVIVNGNLTRNSDDLLLGLIANNFVRVYHPLSWTSSGWGDDDDQCSNGAGSLQNLRIDAAILALNHSFIVDNWYCGNDLGNLRIYGAIAQRFRGPVGTSGGTGYTKAYEYNNRLKYREPPFFLDPVQSAWRVARQNEQVPATK